MDNNQRIAIVLSMVVVTIWLFWENGRIEEAERQAALEASRQAAIEERIPDLEGAEGGAGAVPVQTESAARPPEVEASPARVPDSAGDSEIASWTRVISNDLYEAELSNDGAGFTSWTLKQYSSLVNGKKTAPIELVSPGTAGVAPLTPLIELGYGDLSLARYAVEADEPDRVVFRLTRGDVVVRKTYRFHPDRYEFELELEIHNASSRNVASDVQIVWPSSVMQGNDYSEQSLLALQADEVQRAAIPSVGSPGFFTRLFGGGGEQEIWTGVRWAGADLKYFASLLLPNDGEPSARFDAIEPGVTAATVLWESPKQIPPDASLSRSFTGYLGPKKPSILEAMGHDLSRSINHGYSWVEPLTLFFQWLLNALYGFVPNYGWAIVLITIMVRVATLPIMNRQMRSMERMRALQPRLKEIQEKFADDRQKQSEATMALYKESGVNPLGGCLPMLLQFPVFIGLFYALQSSFALRQAPFMLWITDLSAPEALFTIPGIDLPFRLLPIIMGASMVLQQKFTPTTVDPSQQQMMMVIMPIMMTVLFYQFPSGLVLYWMISNFLGIAHQMLIGRRMKTAEA